MYIYTQDPERWELISFSVPPGIIDYLYSLPLSKALDPTDADTNYEL
jgi:hypothetical protein